MLNTLDSCTVSNSEQYSFAFEDFDFITSPLTEWTKTRTIPWKNVMGNIEETVTTLVLEENLSLSFWSHCIYSSNAIFNFLNCRMWGNTVSRKTIWENRKLKIMK